MKYIDSLKLKYFLVPLLLICSFLFSSSSTNAISVDNFQIPTFTTTGCNLTNSSDGNMWFMKLFEKQLVKLSMDGQMVEYPIPQVESGAQEAGPYGFCSITAGQNGEMWFVSNEYAPNDSTLNSYLRKISPNGQITAYPVEIQDTVDSNPVLNNIGLYNVVVQENGTITIFGGTLPSFGGSEYNMIIKLNANGQVTDYIERPGEPTSFDSIIDSQGNTWFSNGASIYKMNPSGQIDQTALSGISHVSCLIERLNGEIWFCGHTEDVNAFKIGRLHTNGLAEYYDVAGSEQNSAISNGYFSNLPDGNLWFSTVIANPDLTSKSFVIDEQATITEITNVFSPGDYVISLNLGPDGNLWAIVAADDPNSPEEVSSHIVRVNLDGYLPPTNPIPKPPKSGNTTIFLVISTLVLVTFSVFTFYIYKKHIKNEASAR